MMSSGIISADILDYCTVGMVGVATLMSGIISSRITGSAGLAVGSLTGFFIFLVITSISLIFNGEPITILTLLKLMSSVLGGGIGGIIGVNKKEKIIPKTAKDMIIIKIFWIIVITIIINRRTIAIADASPIFWYWKPVSIVLITKVDVPILPPVIIYGISNTDAAPLMARISCNAMIVLIPGKIMCQNFCHAFAPSRSAAS